MDTCGARLGQSQGGEQGERGRKRIYILADVDYEITDVTTLQWLPPPHKYNMADSGKKRKRNVGGAEGSKKKVAIEAPLAPNAKVKVVSEGDKRAPIIGTFSLSSISQSRKPPGPLFFFVCRAFC